MIKDRKRLQRFERELLKKGSPDYNKNLKIIESLLKEAIFLGALPSKNPLDGIEVKVKIARTINSVPKTD